MRCLLPVLLIGVWFVGCSAGPALEDLRDGDIIFQYSQTRQSAAIEAATKSPYTHMGVIFMEGGKAWVYEAVGPVCKTPLREWVSRGRGGEFVVKRLRDDVGFDAADVKAEVGKMLGRSYDWLFDWSDEKIYCSELVWKSYKRSSGLEIGKLKKLREFDLSAPVVRQIMAERYGRDVPLDMKVISPGDMFDSELLVTVGGE